MKAIELSSGNARMLISKVVLGAGPFGTGLSEKEAFWQMDAYLNAGGVTLDTARVYGQWAPGGDGASEKCIGRWIAERKCRNKVFLSTKGAHPELADIHSSRMSRENIVQDLNESLAFLQCDYVDLYFLHRDDTTKPVSFIMDVLDEQVKAGKIRFLGASNWTKSRIDEANAYAVANGKTPFSVSQIQWSLADVKPDAGLDDTLVQMNKNEYDAYLKNPLPVMAFSSQARGFFQKFLMEGEQIADHLRQAYYCEKNIMRCRRAEELAASKQVPVSAVVLAAITCNPLEGAAIIGASRREQLADTLSGCDLELSQQEMAYLWG